MELALEAGNRKHTPRDLSQRFEAGKVIKNSYLKPWQISTFTQLQKACKELIHISNEQRAIHDLGYLSPVKFEELIAELPVSERPIKYLHDFENQI